MYSTFCPPDSSARRVGETVLAATGGGLGLAAGGDVTAFGFGAIGGGLALAAGCDVTGLGLGLVLGSVILLGGDSDG